MNKEYRIIYYVDKRYNNVERYIIVPGTWRDAQNMIDYLKSKPDLFENISRYYNVDGWVIQKVNDQLHLKPQYLKSLSKRDYWR